MLKILGETRHRYDRFHMHSGLPTSTVSLVCEPTELPSVTDWLQQSEEVWDRAHTNLLHAVRRQEQQANRHRRPNPEYTPGQWVWLSTKDLRLRLPCKKLSPRYVGPIKISRQISPVLFCLELPSNYRISPIFHVSLLKPTGGSFLLNCVC